MNDDCVDILFGDDTICLLCKAWVFFYTRVLMHEHFRRWEGEPAYPYRDATDRFHEMFKLPEGILMSDEDFEFFQQACDYWFDICITHNNKFHIIKGLPHSSEGLGVVSRVNGNLQNLHEDLFGVLQFVPHDTFQHLKDFGYFSLYQTRENKFAIMYGPLSLCNSGDNFLNENWPFMEDRDYITDAKFKIQPEIMDDPTEYHMVKMHLHRGTGDKLIAKGDQIFLQYAPPVRVVAPKKRAREGKETPNRHFVVDLTED